MFIKYIHRCDEEDCADNGKPTCSNEEYIIFEFEGDKIVGYNGDTRREFDIKDVLMIFK